MNHFSMENRIIIESLENMLVSEILQRILIEVSYEIGGEGVTGALERE